VRVVIIGQDPYHGPGQAEGLCFSVPRGEKIPSSLRNMYKEAASCIPGFRVPKHGHLMQWASQGILMLNTGMYVCFSIFTSSSPFSFEALSSILSSFYI